MVLNPLWGLAPRVNSHQKLTRESAGRLLSQTLFEGKKVSGNQAFLDGLIPYGDYHDVQIVPLLNADAGQAVVLLEKSGDLLVFYVASIDGKTESALKYQGHQSGKEINWKKLHKEMKRNSEVDFYLSQSIELKSIFEGGENPEVEKTYRALLGHGMDFSEVYLFVETLFYDWNFNKEETHDLAVNKPVDFWEGFVALVNQGIEFDDPSQMYLSVRDLTRWNQETSRWLRHFKKEEEGREGGVEPRITRMDTNGNGWEEEGSLSLVKSFYMGALSNFIENIAPGQKNSEGDLLRDEAKNLFISVFGGDFPQGLSDSDKKKLLDAWDLELDFPGKREGKEGRDGSRIGVRDDGEEEREGGYSGSPIRTESRFTGLLRPMPLEAGVRDDGGEEKDGKEDHRRDAEDAEEEGRSKGETSQEPKKLRKMRSQFKHSRMTGANPLFIKDSGGELFEDIMRAELEEEGAILVTMPLGPHADHTQLLGGLLPEKLIGFEEATNLVNKVFRE